MVNLNFLYSLDIATSFYRNAVGAIIVYDVTNRKSFDHVSKWLKEVEENAHEDCVAMVSILRIRETSLESPHFFLHS